MKNGGRFTYAPDELKEFAPQVHAHSHRPGAGEGARRRRVRTTGKRVRGDDAEPIRAQLAAVHGGSAQERARHQRLEHWRARLLGDDGALTEFVQAHPARDLQQLRALIRNARREQAAGRPPRAFRELFRVLREATGE